MKGGDKGMEGLKVKKRDNRLEAFDRNKVKNGLVKAGATPEQAENVTTQVETWAPSEAVNGVVETNDIRTKVLELLRLANPKAADRFEAYKKPAE